MCAMRRFFLVFLFAVASAFAEEKKLSVEPFREFFKDILLVIHYDQPCYETIDFQTSLYCPVFKYIVYYGGSKAVDPEIDIDVVPTQQGVYFTRVVKDVLEGYPNFKGYIFLQSDSILQFWRCVHLNKEKIWFPQNAKEQFQTHEIDPDYPAGFNQTIGMPELKRALSYLFEEERAMLISNLGKDAVLDHHFDCFYLPARVAPQVVSLCDLLQNVPAHVALPTLLASIEDLRSWEKLDHLRTKSDRAGEFISCYKPEYHVMRVLNLCENRVSIDFAKQTFRKEFYSQLIEEVECD